MGRSRSRSRGRGKKRDSSSSSSRLFFTKMLFYKNNCKNKLLILFQAAPLHLRARLHPHHLHQDHQDRLLIDEEEKILDGEFSLI